MNKSVGFFTLVIALLLTANIFSQTPQLQSNTIDYFRFKMYDFDFTGGGARAEGMGKAYLALSDDVNGGTWNPAGMFMIEKPVMGVSWSSIVPRGTATTSFLNLLNENNHSGSFDAITSFNVAAPVRIKGHPFVGSFNYTRNFDIYEEFGWDLETETEFVTSTNGNITTFDTIPITQHATTQLEGGLYTLNFAFSTRLYDNISAGISANVYTGRSVNTLTQGSLYEGISYDGLQEADVFEDATVIDTNRFSGVNFTIGFKYNAEKFNGALVVRTPFELKVTTDSTVVDTTYINDVRSNAVTIFSDDNVTKYEMPLIIGAGFAYQAKENLLLAGDIEFRNFSGKKVLLRESILINPGGSNIEEYEEIDPEWNNSFTVRLGAEYMKETKFAMVPIRAGFGYIPIPAPNMDSTGSTSTAVKYNFSLGTGLHWEQIHLDLAYTYSALDREVFLTFFESEIENRIHHFNLSFTGVF